VTRARSAAIAGGASRFVAESYWPRPAVEDVAATASRVRRAAASMNRDVAAVRLIRCTLAPADELCSWLFEAESEAAIRSLGSAAGLEFERIAPAIEVWPERASGRRAKG
jgi:hypothetical protein